MAEEQTIWQKAGVTPSAFFGVTSGIMDSFSGLADIASAREIAKASARAASNLMYQGVAEQRQLAEQGQQFAAAQLPKFRGIDITSDSPVDLYRRNMYVSAMNAAATANAYNRRAQQIIASGKQQSRELRTGAITGAIGGLFQAGMSTSS